LKTVLFIRHAKSSWAEPTQADYDRSLNDRGKKDAPMMAQRLLARNLKIDLFISSSAKRARKTALYFAEAFAVKKEEIVLKDELYLAPEIVFYDVISKLDNKKDHVAIFAHNPGITDMVNGLTHVRVDDMPTCAVYAIKINIKSWKDFADAEKEFWFFDHPKNNH
jgi:phosphohistidine phosphatase